MKLSQYSKYVTALTDIIPLFRANTSNGWGTINDVLATAVRVGNASYAVAGLQTVTFQVDGVATPLPSDSYTLIAVTTSQDGSTGFARATARDKNGFKFTTYENNVSVDYIAVCML